MLPDDLLRRRDPEADLGSKVPEIGRAGVRVALLMILPALVLILLVPRGSAEFVISVVTLLLGIAFLGIVVGMTWLINRRF